MKPIPFYKLAKVIFLFPTFLTTVAVLVVSACQSDTLQLKQSPTNLTATQTQIVNHALGKVQIPVNPQRIVVLHDSLILDPIIALSVKPVGIVHSPSIQEGGERFRGIPNDLVANIPEVGNIGQPNLEKILALKPDLILGTHFQRNYYELLSAIAPTVLIDFHEVKDYQERLRYFAQILGKNARAEEILNQYQERIQELRQQLGERLENVTISVIYLQEKQVFSTYGPSSPLVSTRVIQDVGLSVTLAQQHNSDYLQHSIETLPDHDADVLFVMTYRTRDNPEPYSFLQQPIWSQLKAVQNQQVYEVNWHVGGPLGANRVIDDLSKYLVNTP